jgi:hypothetical protein
MNRDAYHCGVAELTRREYQIASLPTEQLPDGTGWIAEADRVLNEEGNDGWRAVLVLKRDSGYVHLLLTRPLPE